MCGVHVRPEDELAIEIVELMGARKIEANRYYLEGGSFQLAVVSFSRDKIPLGVLHYPSEQIRYRIVARHWVKDHVHPHLPGDYVLVLVREEAGFFYRHTRNILGQIKSIGNKGDRGRKKMR
jgi:hypothetical protein